MKHHFFKLVSMPILVLSFLFLFGLTAAADTTIAPNVYVNGICIGNMTKDAALSTLKNNLAPENNNSYVLLKYSYLLWKFDYKTLKVTYNYEQGVNNAISYTQNNPALNSTTPSSITTKAAVSIDKSFPRKDISIGFSYDKKALSNLLDTVGRKIEIKPVDARLSINGKRFQIVAGKNGLALDRNKAVQAIAQNITSNNRKAIILSLNTVKPMHDKDTLVNVKDKLGEYTTRFSSKDVDRVNNISIAAQNLNNVILMPNEIISVNKTIGPRREDTGFKAAHVIVNNELVDGIGGGICQVSTTLYNAVLYANLKIVERTHHSIPSTYVSLGRDATVSGDYKDFKFQNNTKYPLYICSKVTKNHITFTLYGKNDYPSRKVKILTKVLSVIQPTSKVIKDPTAPAGTVVKDKKAYPAYVVESSREVLENGKVLYIEPLYTDKYPLINGLKIIGSKKN